MKSPRHLRPKTAANGAGEGGGFSASFRRGSQASFVEKARGSHAPPSPNSVVSSNDWNECPKGAFARVFAAIHAAQTRRTTAMRVAAILAAVLSLAGGWLVYDAFATHDYGGINCNQVRANLAVYLQGRLPENLSNKIHAHLVECSRCRSLPPPPCDSPLSGGCKPCETPSAAESTSLGTSSGK